MKLVFYRCCLMLWIFILRLHSILKWTIWKRFFDKPEKRTSLWALSLPLQDVPMHPRALSPPSGLPRGRRRARPSVPLRGNGMQEDDLSQKSPHGLPAQPVYLSLHVSLHYGFWAFTFLIIKYILTTTVDIFFLRHCAVHERPKVEREK